MGGRVQGSAIWGDWFFSDGVRGVMDTWIDAVSAWVVALRAAGRAETTIGTRTDHVLRCGRALGGSPWEVTGPDLVQWAGGQAWARETRRSVRASLVVFYRWGVETGRVATSPALALPVVTPGAPRPRPAPERAYRAGSGGC